MGSEAGMVAEEGEGAPTRGGGYAPSLVSMAHPLRRPAEHVLRIGTARDFDHIENRAGFGGGGLGDLVVVDAGVALAGTAFSQVERRGLGSNEPLVLQAGGAPGKPGGEVPAGHLGEELVSIESFVIEIVSVHRVLRGAAGLDGARPSPRGGPRHGQPEGLEENASTLAP